MLTICYVVIHNSTQLRNISRGTWSTNSGTHKEGETGDGELLLWRTKLDNMHISYQ